jgi:hypothetical protein
MAGLCEVVSLEKLEKKTYEVKVKTVQKLRKHVVLAILYCLRLFKSGRASMQRSKLIRKILTNKRNDMRARHPLRRGRSLVVPGVIVPSARMLGMRAAILLSLVERKPEYS